MYQALYRKWRPKTFDDVVGQEHITDVLRGEIIRGSVSHAYLFCGSRGTGKTTCAKILARAVSCENPKDGDPCGECENCKKALESFDIAEIDAASNNGVDNIRELREEVLYPPSELKRRVYTIDEVHMLSNSSFNALLKTLEEPPAYVKFILATTDPQKMPATILSRCQRFDFRIIEGMLFTSEGASKLEEEELRLQEKTAILAKQKVDKEALEVERNQRSECKNLIQEAISLKNEEKYSEALKKLKKASAMDIPEKEEAIRNIKNEIEEQKNKNSLATRFGNWLNTILDENN